MVREPFQSAGQRGQFVGRVVENRRLCLEHHRLTLSLPAFPPTQPGQFIQISCRPLESDGLGEVEHEWGPGQAPELGGLEQESLALLRRPFSLAGRRDTADGVELQIIHRVVGIGTEYLARLELGREVAIIGPLGNVFVEPPDKGVAILVGGGVGIPPMIYLAEKLAGRKAVAFCGALKRELLPLTLTDDAPRPGEQDASPLYNVAEFARHGHGAVIATDDGSYGFRGFVTQALERYLDAWFTDNADRMRAVVYTCGPEAMMKRVAEIATRRSIECQVAVERAMACGMGTCQSCVIRVRKPDASRPPLAGRDWCYRLACTDGPVFRAADLLW